MIIRGRVPNISRTVVIHIDNCKKSEAKALSELIDMFSPLDDKEFIAEVLTEKGQIRKVYNRTPDGEWICRSH